MKPITVIREPVLTEPRTCVAINCLHKDIDLSILEPLKDEINIMKREESPAIEQEEHLEIIEICRCPYISPEPRECEWLNPLSRGLDVRLPMEIFELKREDSPDFDAKEMVTFTKYSFRMN